MSEGRDFTVTRRLVAELELARAVHSLTVHELGNPLQSLLVLIELSRDELRAAGLEGRTLERLDRALDSIERLRRILLSSGAVRTCLTELERVPDWGRLLDALAGFIGERLTQLRATLVRFTDEIDHRPVALGPVREATLSLLIEAVRQVRDARSDGMTVELHGRTLQDRTCLRVAVHGPTGPIELDERTFTQVEALLGDSADARCQRDAQALVLWSS
ncbi:MAG TPA: hypothetical protein VM869_12120 [Enhygromyxa sp.]|nr:hypothetical protein [Enhygromyxa sp.]